MEYNKKEGIGKKFVEGLLVSVVIMGLFFLLQLLLGFVGVTAASDSVYPSDGHGYSGGAARRHTDFHGQ